MQGVRLSLVAPSHMKRPASDALKHPARRLMLKNEIWETAFYDETQVWIRM